MLTQMEAVSWRNKASPSHKFLAQLGTPKIRRKNTNQIRWTPQMLAKLLMFFHVLSQLLQNSRPMYMCIDTICICMFETTLSSYTIYIYIYVYIYICMYTYIYMYTHIFFDLYHICICTTYKFVYMCIYIYMHIYIYIHIYIYTYIHTTYNTYIRIYIYMYIYKQHTIHIYIYTHSWIIVIHRPETSWNETIHWGWFPESNSHHSSDVTTWGLYNSSRYISGFPSMGALPNGWFIMENTIKMDDLGVPLFHETSISVKPELQPTASRQWHRSMMVNVTLIHNSTDSPSTSIPFFYYPHHKNS